MNALTESIDYVIAANTYQKKEAKLCLFTRHEVLSFASFDFLSNKLNWKLKPKNRNQMKAIKEKSLRNVFQRLIRLVTNTSK